MDAPHIEDTVTDHAADAEDIRRVIADAEKAFNAKDPDLLVEHFASQRHRRRSHWCPARR